MYTVVDTAADFEHRVNIATTRMPSKTGCRLYDKAMGDAPVYTGSSSGDENASKSPLLCFENVLK
jgi:hypothetical protein